MSLTRADVEQVLTEVVRRVPAAEFRLVGSASSLIRGIGMPAADIDVLLRERAAVDAWVVAMEVRHEVESPPRWLEPERQYFARLIVDGALLELSTVEWDADSDTFECAGTGPWVHCDVVPIDRGTIPVVATELRLLSELARDRRDRVEALIEHLRSSPCDVDLLRRGLPRLGLDDERAASILSRLRH